MRTDRSDALPLVCRLAVIYLPLAVWLLGWFEWWFGIPAVALVGAGGEPCPLAS